MAMEQSELFSAAPVLPPGMVFCGEFISRHQELELIDAIHALPFHEAQYKEWQARRRIVSYGGRYDFSRNELQATDPIPDFLHPLRQRVAAWAGLAPGQFSHALINEYRPGTPLGWHRDAPVYDTIVGVSLAGAGRIRLRPYPPGRDSGPAQVLEVAPRSAYILRGAVRWDWQHAISPTKALRYSITFRTLVQR